MSGSPALSWLRAGLSTLLGELAPGQLEVAWAALHPLCPSCAAWAPSSAGMGLWSLWAASHCTHVQHGESLGPREMQNSHTGWVYSNYLQIVMEETAPKWHLWPLCFFKCYSTTQIAVTGPELICRVIKPEF